MYALVLQDLRSRKFFSGAQNDMFVARRVVVVPASSALILSSPPIVDMSIIYNREGLPKRPQDNDLEFIRGDVIGFCEVSERPFGLGKNFDEQSEGGYREKRPIRPLLTNLSVRPDVRKSGLGSQLVRVCEDAVLQWDPAYDEIVLQVEEDNPMAMQFYEKRGYTSLFADPSCRRFDTSGIFLQQVRTTKICMRKSLRRGLIGDGNGKGTIGSFFGNGSLFFDKLRDAILTNIK
jgi:ribosomal protein S18 acetylase RimI-like enzyme